MKDYRTSMDHLSFSPDQKQAMTARLAAATRQKAAPPKARRTRRILAVAVAAALVLSLGTAGATGALRPAGEFFAHLLGGSSAQQAAADRMSSAVGVSATADGYTITVDGVMGDEANCLIRYTLSSQDGTPLTLPGWVDGETYLGYSFQDAHGSQEFYDEDPEDGTIQFVEWISLHEEHPQETVTRTFQNLYFGDYGKGEGNVIAQGPWELTFPLTYENTSLTLDAGQMLQLKEHGIVLDEVTLSPLSVTVKSSFPTVVDWEEDVPSDPFADYEDMPDGMAAMNLPITVTLKDGTSAETVGNSASIGDRDGKTVCRNNVRFREIVPLEDIASITVGTVTLPLAGEAGG